MEASLRLLLRLAVMTSSSRDSTPGRVAAAHRMYSLNAIARLAQVGCACDSPWSAT